MMIGDLEADGVAVSVAAEQLAAENIPLDVLGLTRSLVRDVPGVVDPSERAADVVLRSNRLFREKQVGQRFRRYSGEYHPVRNKRTGRKTCGYNTTQHEQWPPTGPSHFTRLTPPATYRQARN